MELAVLHIWYASPTLDCPRPLTSSPSVTERRTDPFFIENEERKRKKTMYFSATESPAWINHQCQKSFHSFINRHSLPRHMPGQLCIIHSHTFVCVCECVSARMCVCTQAWHACMCWRFAPLCTPFPSLFYLNVGGKCGGELKPAKSSHWPWEHCFLNIFLPISSSLLACSE